MGTVVTVIVGTCVVWLLILGLISWTGGFDDYDDDW